jgi:hypothetical protein
MQGISMAVRFFLTVALILGSATVAAFVHKPAKVSLVGSAPPDTSPIAAAHRATGAPTELEVRQEIYDRVEKLMVARDYAAIDAMEQRYLKGRELTPSGVPKLYELHAAIQNTFGNPHPHTYCMMAGEMVLGEWERTSPKSPTIYITEAAVHMKRAWCWRGNGYAYGVTSEGWSKFRANVAAAEAVLAAHKDVAAQDPEYYSIMEDVYQAQQRSRFEFESLLKEASAADPYYYPIYWGAYFYNMPQWYGSDVKVDAAARFAVERTRSRDGLGAYARYYWRASEQNCDCWKTAIDWPSMKQAMRDVSKRYPDPWNLANFAKLSCRMNDPQTAKAYFTALGRYDGSEAWPDDQAGWQQCRRLAGV